MYTHTRTHTMTRTSGAALTSDGVAHNHEEVDGQEVDDVWEGPTDGLEKALSAWCDAEIPRQP